MESNSTGTNPVITAYDIAAVFTGDNEYDDRDVVLASGSTLTVGTVLGALTASGNFAQFKSGNADGTENPRAVLAETIVDGGTGGTKENVRVCITGKVDDDGLVFNGTDTIDTVVASKGKVKDLMKTEGLIVNEGRELSSLDNGASLS